MKQWNMVGESEAMRELRARIEKVAPSSLPVLIRGETGTGKELVARAIHAGSERRGPFVSENCAALSESLLESELFGHERGAFTDARRRREGLFAQADGGTLFLDEVGDMSLGMQAKLLRVLQEGELRRVGGDRPRRVQARVVAATHRDLEAAVESGTFRADLFYRLAVLTVEVPPLRQRLEDLPLLVEHFLALWGGELRCDEETLQALRQRSWPGNVRELENAVRVAALEAAAGEPAWQLPPPPPPEDGLSYAQLRSELEARERRFVKGVLEHTLGVKTEAARELGVSRYALYRTMRRLGIDLAPREAIKLSPPLPRRKTG